MKYSSIIFTFVIIILHSCSKPSSKYNGGFEKLDEDKIPVGWQWANEKEQSDDYLIAVDSTVKEEGKYSLHIFQKGATPSFGVCKYIIPRTYKGKELELKGYLKTENVSGGFAGLWMRVDGQDGMLAFDNMQDKSITGTTDWNEYSIKLPYDDGIANTINIGGLLVGKGKIWIDNLRLFIDGKPIENATSKNIIFKKAQLDTSFSRNSGIDSIKLTKQKIINLTLFGQVWGFLKYHNPSVAKGDYNFDAELFKAMPLIIKASNNSELSDALEHWIDKFEKPGLCNSCQLPLSGDIKCEPDYGDIFNDNILKKSLINKLRYILRNHDFNENYYVELDPNIGNPLFTHELPYNTVTKPDVGFRLLCLFRYWNMIQYYYPYKHLIGSNWDNVLKDFIPRFVKAKDSTGYVITTLALISSIHDTHANIWSNNPTLDAYKGKYEIPLQAKFIENHLTVTGFYLDTLDIKKKANIGDVIISINGVKIEDLIKKYLPITAASNYTTQLREMPNNFLLRFNKKVVSLEIVHNRNKRTMKIIAIERKKLNKSIDYDPHPSQPYYANLNSQIGYIFPGKYKNVDLPLIEQKFRSTKGIIVDMRCYPSDFMPFTFVPFIKRGNSDFVMYRTASLKNPGYFELKNPLNIVGTGDYNGRVVVIVNEMTQSQAEYTTMAFQSSPNVIVIGSRTAGADGNVSNISLPGGISTMISGLDILYPDGTETQRNGVKIDYIVKPTIKGISLGKDELLDKAKEIILNN
ncbi:S41 family peptidase [Mucilaginibacter gotjawali]|uniref:Peptidase family S41 n=2 Tax=Mucilaginibacter gotjawali TaxID=1550579 RepID=A0A0X8X4Q5_9SPHI|nr:S41 family peptidase [Mucilaginibacter gotjawali]MBB3058271.1 C-terminal processing protease CtpA/Prc [Mucilaginibacter gotjawali]BAU55611.1 Peptidase family S41 [Mucilaginibacter gotjawali]